MSTPARTEPATAAAAVRLARPEEYDAVGALTVSAYVAGGHLPADADYTAELREVEQRAAADRTEVLVALDEQGRVAGSVTLAFPGSPYAEVSRDGEAEFRMLAVAPPVSGRGVGTTLVRACLARARGCTGMALSTQASMGAAHRIYGRLGFHRAPTRDWSPVPGVDLHVYELAL